MKIQEKQKPAVASGVERRKWLEKQNWFRSTEYDFSSHFFEVEPGLNMHYLDEGKGEKVLFLVHGTPGWSFEFRHMIKAMVAAGYRLIVPDHLGFGLSDRPADWGYSPRDHAKNLIALAQHIRTGNSGTGKPDGVRFVLHDFGGMIGLAAANAMASQGLAPESITVLNSWCRPFAETDPSFQKQVPILRSAFMRWMYRHWNLSAKFLVKSAWGKNRLDPNIHKHFTGLHRNATDRAGTVGFLRATYHDEDVDFLNKTVADSMEILSQVPFQIIWGMQDGLVGIHHIQEWSSRFSVQSLVEVPDAGHFPHEEQPRRVNEEILKFVIRNPMAHGKTTNR
jgi:pimeloyl-ACP methyl ester carboxylesterase